MQLRYLTLCDEYGSWTRPKLEYTEDDDASPYEVGPDDGWKEIPYVEAKTWHRKKD